MKPAGSYSQVLAAATRRLQKTSDSAYIDAQSLLCHLLQCNSAHLAAWPEKTLSAEQLQRYETLISSREAGTPVAYITGQREFWSLPLRVTPATLIPRPETECLVEFVLEHFDASQKLQLADLGTGSGAIAIALASECPHWSFTATDISADALAVARENASSHQLNNISFIESHWFDAMQQQRFDIIISNPPYVADDDAHLQAGDAACEPRSALASGVHGMDDIEQLCREAPQHLQQNGWLIVEHGYEQKQRVLDCFNTAGYDPVIQKHDLSNQPRLTAGCFSRS